LGRCFLAVLSRDTEPRGELGISELCRRFGIRRKTGYKWVDRFYGDGADDEEALRDRSRRPHSHPRAVPTWLEEAIVEARRQRPHWGPKKLCAVLVHRNPGAELPAVSTFAKIFRRQGLVRPRRRSRGTPPSSAPFGAITGANALWCMDFKGHFAVGRVRCHPLTVMDAYSRYLIACVALRYPDAIPVRRAFERIFDEFGLPETIRTDNGPPFASPTAGGLSRLSAWWLKLGIRHERIAHGKPQENGRHEHMHRTLEQETASPPASLRRRLRDGAHRQARRRPLARVLAPDQLGRPSRTPRPRSDRARCLASPLRSLGLWSHRTSRIGSLPSEIRARERPPERPGALPGVAHVRACTRERIGIGRRTGCNRLAPRSTGSRARS
jgi:hypothetical protein